MNSEMVELHLPGRHVPAVARPAVAAARPETQGCIFTMGHTFTTEGGAGR